MMLNSATKFEDFTDEQIELLKEIHMEIVHLCATTGEMSYKQNATIVLQNHDTATTDLYWSYAMISKDKNESKEIKKPTKAKDRKCAIL